MVMANASSPKGWPVRDFTGEILSTAHSVMAVSRSVPTEGNQADRPPEPGCRASPCAVSPGEIRTRGQPLLRKNILAAAREKGLVGMEGKDYVVKDGDVILFRFNV